MTENVDHGFSMKRGEAGAVEFEARGSGIGGGAWFGIIFFGLFIGFLAFLMQAFDKNPSATPSIVIIAISFGIAFLMSKQKSQTYQFKVSPDSVHVGGKEYKKSDISELLVRNSSGQAAHNVNVEGGTVVFGTGVAGAAYVGATVLGNSAKQIGAATGQAIQESLAKRGNSVCIRHGRKVVPLAGNLKEDDAVSLFNKVAETM